MRSGLKDLLTGLASIVALVGMAVLLMRYGELAGVADRGWPLDVRLDDGGGLRPGSKVTLNGVGIGEIAEVRLDETSSHPDHPVLVEARIEKGRRIPGTATATVETSLLGGGASLSLRMPLPLPPDVEYLTESSTSPQITGRVGGLAAMFEQALEPRLAGLDAGIEDLRAMAQTYTRLGRNLDDLVRPVDPDDPAAEQNLRTTVLRVNATLSEARAAVAFAGEWLGDEQLRQDVRNVVWRAGVMLEHTVEAVDSVAALAGSLETDADEVVALLDRRTSEVLAAIVPVAEQSSVLLERLGELARLAAEGDGTVGRLLRDPDLHESLRESARRLEETLRKAGLLLDKIREEGLGVSLD
ncbi:MAG: MlaD family protein [Phycisphaerales bacterium]|jgi:hypothetical protein